MPAITGKPGGQEEIMKLFLSLLCCLSFYFPGNPACGSGTELNDQGGNEQKTVDAMQALTAELANPLELFRKNEIRNGMKFDPTSFFTVLKNISLPEGKILDYFYQMEPSSGYPLLYVRSQDQKPYKNREEYEKAQNNRQAGREDILNTVVQMLVVEDSKAGYFEYAVFYLLAPNFYLHKWANTDLKIVCHATGLDEILKNSSKIPATAVAAAKKLELAPQIVLAPDEVKVKLITFSAWGGFFAEDFVVSRSLPHTLLQHSKKCLVEYNCGIKF